MSAYNRAMANLTKDERDHLDLLIECGSDLTEELHEASKYANDDDAAAIMKRSDKIAQAMAVFAQ